ncbi:efflux RND transporter periplasmic adaptor subunit [Rhodovulum strictum]|uniref:Efflux RND transporter periplasmic adaptor subunit n=1 Tax=Rhodovulum strictum TaxID=58314 RepID=A0A844BQK4_9RHOB|nr:efflux RND transporter periplasmic adaptor subunit [Rhodovulum strictum]MRH22237.1 efflux RND transporter periplasmic adaptor subunit [Rhodovulum strictum]
MTTPVQQKWSDPAREAAPAEASDRRLPAVRPSPASPAPRLRRIWIVGLVLAGGAGLGFFLQPWASSPVVVAVETVTLAPVTRILAVNGRIEALHSVDVRAQVGGTLADLSVVEGDSVQSGGIVARIDSTAQQAVLRQAMAGLDAALVAQAQAQATLERTRALGANVARTVLENAETAVQSAAQEAARMTALVDQAQIQLGNFTIRAPMTGTVLALNADPGQTIDPSTVLMTIADLGQLTVETDVDEAYATQLRADMPAVLQLTGETAKREGRVSYVSQRVDAATGGLAVKLVFDEPVTAPVGLTVTANIVIDRRDAALTVPRTAVVTGDGRPAVLVVSDGIARLRPVTVIDWPAARLIVTEGLVPGDALILDATGIADGQSVRVEQP